MSIREALAGAIRATNAAYDRLPPAAQDAVQIGYDSLEAKVNETVLAEDQEAAFTAITAWRDHWLAEFARVAEGIRGEAA